YTLWARRPTHQREARNGAALLELDRSIAKLGSQIAIPPSRTRLARTRRINDLSAIRPGTVRARSLAMRAGSIRAGASVILGAMVSAALVLGCAGDEAPSTQAPSPEPSAPLPREWTCPADAPHVLVAQEPASHAPLAPVPGALAPVVTSMSPASGPLLAAIALHGTNLRTGADGEYISFGAGEREVRIVPSSWSSDSLYFRAPLGAQGDVVVHTAGGEAKAGAFEPTFRSSAVYRLPPAVAYTSS